MLNLKQLDRELKAIEKHNARVKKEHTFDNKKEQRELLGNIYSEANNLIAKLKQLNLQQIEIEDVPIQDIVIEDEMKLKRSNTIDDIKRKREDNLLKVPELKLGEREIKRRNSAIHLKPLPTIQVKSKSISRQAISTIQNKPSSSIKMKPRK